MNTGEPTAEELDFVKQHLGAALGNKRVRRAARRRLEQDLARQMEQGVLGHGVAGRCGALRPSQIRAAAKQRAQIESSAALRAWKERG